MSYPSTLRIFKSYMRFAPLRYKQNFLMVLLIDVLVIILAFIFSLLLRFDGILTTEYFEQAQILIPCLLCLKLPIFYFFGLYNGMWRYTSLSDLFSILKATLTSSALLFVSLMLINRFEGFSRGVFVIDALLTFVLLASNRTLIRCFYQYGNIPLANHSPNNIESSSTHTSAEKKILLIGAGNTADKIIRETQENRKLSYKVIGLVDDDHRKTGLKIHGKQIFGPLDRLESIVAEQQPDELLIAISTISGNEMSRIVNACHKTGIPFKTLPGLHELIDGEVTVQASREVSYTDLLGRPSVQLEQDEIGRCLSGKTVLVTGAGGSIGSELCRQIIKFGPERIILFDSGEENLYNIQMKLEHEHKYRNIIPILGKIQNRRLLENLFCNYSPSIVFHAAAYKHVPLIEKNPWEAVFNNVFAVRNVIEASINHEVERFVLVSTDKAVRPTNVMGATKRLTELLMLAYSQQNWHPILSQDREKYLNHNGPIKENQPQTHKTTFMAVRFGNVLGSSGSVIPLFKQQIKQGGPLTVTHPEITRYFMSIEEAAQLILQAGIMGHGGEIFILKMGEPVKILKLAQDLIRLSSKQSRHGIDIEFVGIRPGEKLYEELITDGEGIVGTDHEKIMVLRGDGKPYSELKEPLRRLAERALAHDARGIKEVLSEIIPEYTPDLNVESVADPATRVLGVP